jgi:S-methylmethionine-dependent homocysteine/selenocysteine methylase
MYISRTHRLIVPASANCFANISSSVNCAKFKKEREMRKQLQEKHITNPIRVATNSTEEQSRQRERESNIIKYYLPMLVKVVWACNHKL